MKALHYIFSVGLILLPLCLGTQTKGETKLYNKTVKAFSVKSADKFLKKYPQEQDFPSLPVHQAHEIAAIVRLFAA